MKKIFFILSFLYILSFAYELKLNSNVTALKFHEQNLYIGTDKGEVLKYHIQNKNLKKLLSLAKIKNYYGEDFSKIYSIDIFENTLLVLSEGDFGTKNLSFYNNELQINKLKDNGIIKAFFIDKNTYLLVSMGSEIKSVDKNLFYIKEFSFSHSSLNDAVLSEDRSKLLAGFESGEVELFDLKNWKILKNYDKMHKDNIYQVDFKNNTILSCGTDRRIVLIKDGRQNFLQKDFLIYACALDPSGNLAIYSDNEAGICEVFDTNTFKSLKVFDNKNLMVEFIVFLNYKDFVFSGFGQSIMFRSIDE
ncbi:WD40 repeat domain-containing protein [Campylobacter sp. VicNov18]|uniref:WD40 repeat domain-containing protein n=1 Tax=Campylobacter bilis TaxID=2691918 RepID=UPI00130E3C21|nr:WD40 repeat domain-containing protein [Campylobacter bilis]MPV63600.1 WD40 repeat domain-containing protein [Campylobacter hepaticus]MBM0637100.1 WD40 repeat domain-containing protein [Campylobacter bilis]MCC8277741.1 WD40 repeat domain-containing protein [Campylobacter bilis]MCC8299350.1 WD40 repeat domain-containing protein [Campylobacter bilis]MCC8300650.1 WD40 repeat domain-containing protein [Campylobacter bilis]